MAIPLPQSPAPIAFDALPALKVRHYYGAGPNIYTLARLYALGDCLALSLAAFERDPAEDSAITFALCGQGAPPLRVHAWPDGSLGLSLELEPEEPGAALEGDSIGGSDEQGWYWGANLLLPAGLLALAGCRLTPGERFCGGLFKHSWGREEAGIGSAFPLRDPANPYDPAGFGQFETIRF